MQGALSGNSPVLPKAAGAPLEREGLVGRWGPIMDGSLRSLLLRHHRMFTVIHAALLKQFQVHKTLLIGGWTCF